MKLSGITNRLKAIDLHSDRSTRFFFLGSVFVMLAVSVFIAYSATNTFTGTNGDELANTYMVGDGWERHGFTVLDIHTNLLKMPVLFLQSKIGMDIAAFIVVNTLLVIITNLLWLWLLSKIFKGWPLIVSTLALACFQLGGILFGINFVFKSFRNIEIAIAGWLIYLLATQLHKIKPAKLLVFTLLYGLLISGDAYYQYTLSIPLLVILGIFWLRKLISTRSLIGLGSAVMASSLVAVIVNKVIMYTGLFSVLFGYQGKTYFIPYDQIGQQLNTAIREALRIFGADFFGTTLDRNSLGSLICMVLLVLCLFGSIAILKHLFRIKESRLSKPASTQLFMLGLGVLVPLVTFLIYILSGQAKPDSESARYLILLPFWAVFGLGFIMQDLARQRRSMNVLMALFIMFGIVINVPVIKTHYANLRADFNVNNAYYQAINNTMNSDKIGIVVSGHWTATPLRFWGDTKLQSAAIQNCDEPLVFLSRSDWYRPSAQPDSTNSALVIDRYKDTMAWNCTDEQLMQYYGKPTIIKTVANPLAIRAGNPDGVTTIWEYNYDVRTKLSTQN